MNGGTIRRNIRQAGLDYDYQQLLLKSQSATVGTDIQNAYMSYELQKQVLEVEEENIQLARENVNISRERLRLGITTSLELRETQKSLADAYNRLIAARFNAKVAETDLLRLQGSLVN